MIKISWTNKFRKKLENYLAKYPLSKAKLMETLALFAENPNHPKLKKHKLSGKLKDSQAIAVEYDCRIVFYMPETNEAVFTNIGSHDDVY